MENQTMPNTSEKKHKLIVILVIIAVLFSIVNLAVLLTMDSEKSDSPLGVLKHNCELSDGEFIDGSCICPIEEAAGQTQEMMYDKNTGYCQTTHGGPGGEAFYVGSSSMFFNEIKELKGQIDAMESEEPQSMRPPTIFDPPGLFDQATKDELVERIAKPYLLYNEGKDIRLILFEKKDVNTHNASGNIVRFFTSGGYEGWVIELEEDGSLMWYTPACFEECVYSEEFKRAYPQIVERTEVVF